MLLPTCIRIYSMRASTLQLPPSYPCTPNKTVDAVTGMFHRGAWCCQMRRRSYYAVETRITLSPLLIQALHYRSIGQCSRDQQFDANSARMLRCLRVQLQMHIHKINIRSETTHFQLVNLMPAPAVYGAGQLASVRTEKAAQEDRSGVQRMPTSGERRARLCATLPLSRARMCACSTPPIQRETGSADALADGLLESLDGGLDGGGGDEGDVAEAVEAEGPRRRVTDSARALGLA
eukprot:401053-Pleurochrysis_carterae.AAC.5